MQKVPLFMLILLISFVNSFRLAKEKFLHGSVDCNHFVIIVWIVENIVNILLTGSSSNNSSSSMPIGGDIP